jgi:hypothetical protein
MNYEAIQQLRRDILSGYYIAPDQPGLLERSRPHKRKRRQPIVQNVDDDWNENAFQDNFYEEDNEEGVEDVVPEYFLSCERMVTTYPEDQRVKENISIRPLFPGRAYSAKDLARFLLSFKARHLKLGDGILANIVAIMATFLPRDNVFKLCLSDSTSTYFLLKALDNLAAYTTNLRTLRVHCCIKKCIGFYDGREAMNFCSECGECRWKLCSRACYGEDDEKTCNHNQTPRNVVYYNVVQDRLVKLLKSDLKNLFNYQSHRGGMYVTVLNSLDVSLTVLMCLELSS